MRIPYRYRHLIVFFYLFLYLVGCFCTYGYVKARRWGTINESGMAGLFWPAYWALRGIYEVGDISERIFTPAPPPAPVKPEKG